MINNDMYRGGMGIEETDLTTGTHCTSHSQISDNNYNTLGERDYEVIHNMPFHNNHASSNGDTKQEYHRLQRPSPPAVPTGRNGVFGYSPPSGEFRSMSTLTSQMNGLDSFCRKEEPGFTSKSGYSTLIPVKYMSTGNWKTQPPVCPEGIFPTVGYTTLQPTRAHRTVLRSLNVGTVLPSFSLLCHPEALDFARPRVLQTTPASTNLYTIQFLVLEENHSSKNRSTPFRRYQRLAQSLPIPPTPLHSL